MGWIALEAPAVGGASIPMAVIAGRVYRRSAIGPCR